MASKGCLSGLGNYEKLGRTFLSRNQRPGILCFGFFFFFACF